MRPRTRGAQLVLLVAVVAACSPTGPSACPPAVGELVQDLAELQELTPGLTAGSLDDYGAYVGRLVQVRDALEATEEASVSPECRSRVVAPAARAYRLHVEARDLWRDCEAAGFCVLQPRLDRIWTDTAVQLSVALERL